MKKPKIEVRPAARYERMGVHIFINDRAPSLHQISERYEGMIDALIAAHVFIYGVAQHGIPSDEKLYEKTITRIEQALKKSGCYEQD